MGAFAGKDSNKPIGGNIIAHASTTRYVRSATVTRLQLGTSTVMCIYRFLLYDRWI